MLDQLAYLGVRYEHVILLLIFLIILYLLKSRFVVISHWHHTYDGAKFSAMDFYKAAEDAIKERNMPGVYFYRVTHKNRIFFSGSREYLRVVRSSNAFDICAAPNGTGCYISWWNHQNYNNFERIVLMRIPILNWMYRAQTLHQYDLELLFGDVVHACVIEAADAMTGQTGSTLSEAERTIIRNWGAMSMK